MARGVVATLRAILEDAIPNVLSNPRRVWRVGSLARRADLTAELADLEARHLPVLVLWGEGDGIIPRASFEALCAAVGSAGTVVPGRHSWLLADPDSFGGGDGQLGHRGPGRPAAPAVGRPAPAEIVPDPPGRRRRQSPSSAASGGDLARSSASARTSPRTGAGRCGSATLSSPCSRSTGALVAVENVCRHVGNPIDDGLVEGGCVTCPGTAGATTCARAST